MVYIHLKVFGKVCWGRVIIINVIPIGKDSYKRQKANLYKKKEGRR